MTHQAHRSVTNEAVQLLFEHGFEGMAQAMALLINECMKIERQQVLGVGPYQRSEARHGQANGFKPRRVKTRIGTLELAVPQVRGAKFYPRALERGSRSEKALRLALAEMYVQGVSTAKVTKIAEKLCGSEISSSDVSRATALLDEELQKWRSRPLDPMKYLILDARYEKVRVEGQVRDCSVLLAVGVSVEGRRSVLGVSVSLSEAEVHWREFFKSHRAWLARDRAPYQRRASRPQRSAEGVLPRRALAALPVPHDAQRPGARAQGRHETRSVRRPQVRVRIQR